MTSTVTLDSAAVLAAVRRDRAVADAAEVRIVESALAWARLHQVDADSSRVATWGDSPIPIAGQGAPQVSEFCISEFGATLRISTDSARNLLAHALELGHRLPRTWGRVQAADLRVWRARKVAEKTLSLSMAAARFVDEQVAGFAHRIGVAELDRLVDTAITRFMPEHAEQIAAQAEQSQYVEIAADQPSFTGTCRLTGELDLPDALDLEQAVRAGAEQQKDFGSELPLGARRAKALGNLARGELVFDYNSGLPEPAPTTGQVKAPTVAKRQVELYLHLSEQALLTSDTGLMENSGRQLVTAEQIREWCATAATVTVRPVLDLNQAITSTGYQPSDLLREQVILRDKICVFPFCGKTARTADLDHIEPYDPDGPPGQTSTDKLGCLCRGHHRLKTHGGWTYSTIEPGTYLWRSPHGYQYLRRPDGGTEDLTPRPPPSPDG